MQAVPQVYLDRWVWCLQLHAKQQDIFCFSPQNMVMTWERQQCACSGAKSGSAPSRPREQAALKGHQCFTKVTSIIHAPGVISLGHSLLSEKPLLSDRVAQVTSLQTKGRCCARRGHPKLYHNLRKTWYFYVLGTSVFWSQGGKLVNLGFIGMRRSQWGYRRWPEGGLCSSVCVLLPSWLPELLFDLCIDACVVKPVSRRYGQGSGKMSR